LQAYQSVLGDIDDLGGSLVAVSPMLPDGSLSMVQKNALAFEVLSDVGNSAAREYGLVFRVSDEIREIYRGWGIELPAVNGDESWELPVPGTFVVDSGGIIRYAFVDPDHTKRAEPGDVLAALRGAV
jgi:peroxiredoxin